MIPLSDINPRRTFPIVNYLIIALNIVVFIMELGAYNTDTFISQYAFTPAQFSLFSPAAYVHIFSAMFMHGSLMHILGNMWFLHIFGDNIEDEFGHMRYALFYLIGGVVATLVQYAVMPDSTIPQLGASGAVAAVAGAYFLLFRNSEVRSIVTLLVIWTIVRVPAWIILGYWFAVQLFSGIASLGVSQDAGGVAFFAHIGGFVFGLIATKFFRPRIQYL